MGLTDTAVSAGICFGLGYLYGRGELTEDKINDRARVFCQDKDPDTKVIGNLTCAEFERMVRDAAKHVPDPPVMPKS